MIDYQNLPSNSQVDWFMQPTPGSEVHTWTKPAGCNFVYMVAVGGGGGGQGASSNGGGGGTSGALSSLLVPAFLIPDTLFVKIGNGGAGATGFGTFGSAGNATIISAYRISSATEYLLNSTGGNGGGSGSTPTPPITNSPLGSIGKFQSSAGQVGSTGGPGNGAPVTSQYILTGGAGGAGTSSGTTERIGGSIFSTFGQVSLLSVVLGGAAGGTNGGDGFWIPKRFAFYGGAGGGSSLSVSGGKGGNGGPGCGGGGGAAGTSNGAGGKGGDGFVLIISY